MAWSRSLAWQAHRRSGRTGNARGASLREADVAATIAGRLAAAASPADCDTILSLIGEAARALCGADLAAIVEPTSSGARWQVRAVVPPSSSHGTDVVLEPNTTRGTVLATARPLKRTGTRRLGIDPVYGRPIGAALAVPVRLRGEAAAVLDVARGDPRSFDAKSQRMLARLAAHAGAVLHVRQFHAAALQRDREARGLIALQRLFTVAVTPEHVGRWIAESVRVLLHGRAAALLRIEPTSEDLVAIALVGDVGYLPDHRLVFPRGTGLVGLAVRERHPAATPNILTDTRLTLTPENRLRVAGTPLRSGLAVPLVARDEAIGALVVWDDRRRVFSQEETQFLHSYAAHVAVLLDNARLFEEIRRHEQRAIEHVTNLHEAIATERARVGQELHDTLSQMLFSIGLKLDWCLHEAPSNTALANRLHEIREQAGFVMSELRRIIASVSADDRTNDTLASRVRDLVEQFRELTGVPVELVWVGDLSSLHPRCEEVAFKVLREALVNVAKHARASSVRVCLEMQDGMVCLEVTDDGVGPPDSVVSSASLGKPGPHFGIRQMRERLEAAGGQLEIARHAPRGCRVSATVPRE